MRFDILTLFPEMFTSFLSSSIIGRAVNNKCIDINLVQIRDFSKSKHKKVDGTPCGGGPGMVMALQPLRDALLSIHKNAQTRVIYLSPRGRVLNHKIAYELSKYDQIIFVCGHYEGVDQRFIDLYVDEELSIGDYVLTGGELAGMVCIDAISRFKDSVLGNEFSHAQDSFGNGLLEYPQYTRPVEIDGMKVPEVLLSGHHKNIEEWRLSQSIEITKERRPDLYENFIAENPEVLKQKKKNNK